MREGSYRQWWLLLVGLGCTSTGVGNPVGDDLDTAEQAVFELGADATEAGDTASSLVWVPMVGLSEASALATAEAFGDAAQRRTPLFFQPSGCLQTVAAGATTTFDFEACRTGILGLGSLQGGMTATYALGTGSSLDVTIGTPSGMTVWEVPVMLAAQASISIADTTRTLVWNGAYHAERIVRSPIDHSASYQAVYDASTQCLTLAGSATTTLATGVGVESVLADYARCGTRTACPQKGTLTLTRLPDRALSIVIEYLGDRSAAVRLPHRSATVVKTLTCRE